VDGAPNNRTPTVENECGLYSRLPIGKLAIGWYIGTQGLESTYGAAASIVVLLIWVYYSAQIVLFGAEMTHILNTRERTQEGSS
jgi:membrane protein